MRHTLRAGALVALLLPCAARGADKEDVSQAIDAGVTALRSLQKPDGSWRYSAGLAPATIGSTALAGLTLLECGAAKDDRAVLGAAEFVRVQSVNLRFTYSISLAIIFLDRLGDPADVPLIESLAARLVAGQHPGGNWSYDCPEPVVAEQRRLSELTARRAPNDERPAPARPADGARSFQQRVLLVNREAAPGAAGSMFSRPDNSNTQFAVIALWVSRRYGYPVDHALKAAERHFRTTRNPDGAWGYGDELVRLAPSTATMTCAGLLGVAVGYGVANDKAKETGKSVRDLSSDPVLQSGLNFLALSIGTPLEKAPVDRSGGGRGRRGRGGRQGLARGVGPAGGQTAMGKSYYFLWSVERVAVALNLETIGRKDWYNWGADVLLLSQGEDGTWSGEYKEGGVDTCFALLFLKRSNLASDLSKLTGRVQDPGQRVLVSGGVGGTALGGGPKTDKGDMDDKEARPAPAPADAPPAPAGKVPVPAGKSPAPAEAPAPAKPAAPQPAGTVLGDSPGDKLAATLLRLPSDAQGTEIERLRDQKGAVHTEALAAAIPLLNAEMRRKARDALAAREARMRLDTIGRDLHDENAEIRGAAARACSLKQGTNKETRQFIPQLIGLLSDQDVLVARAAHDSLKDLSGEDFGPSSAAGEAGRKEAAGRWQAWWKRQSH
jgi:hypothetical protein